MPYTQQNWINDPSGGTPLSATRLAYMESGIASADVKAERADTRVEDIRKYGAVAGGSASANTAAIQAAINTLPANGGTILIPPGTFSINDAITLRSKLVLIGAGDGASVLQQTVTNKDIFTGSALQRITMSGLYLTGTGSGTGSGINLTKGANASVPYVTLRDITIDSAGQDGVAIENPIVSVLSRVVAQTCGRYGINLYGQSGGAAGTSTDLEACYGNTCVTAGIRLFKMVYCNLHACAADHNPIGHLIDTCEVITLSGCGAEGNTVNGLKITAGRDNSVTGLYVFDNRSVGVYITGSAAKTTLQAARDNTPNGTAVNFIKTDSGVTSCALINCDNVTANSLFAGTTTTLI